MAICFVEADTFFEFSTDATSKPGRVVSTDGKPADAGDMWPDSILILLYFNQRTRTRERHALITHHSTSPTVEKIGHSITTTHERHNVR